MWCRVEFSFWVKLQVDMIQQTKSQLKYSYFILSSLTTGVAIYDPKRAQNTNDMVNCSELICFDHNFIPNIVINLIF